MDLLTVAEPRIANRIAVRRWPASVFAVYMLLAVVAVARHEPWADEAQSWLLARDASLGELWTRLLHFEGTTGLWQTLLHPLAAAGVPYAGMNLIGVVLGMGAAALVLWRSPFPLAIRAALPFTYFFCYQYAVIGRSYDLLPLLVCLCAAWFDTAVERPGRFTVALCLMAAVSVHGMILAVSIGIAVIAHRGFSKRILPHTAVFLLAISLLCLAAWPAPDQAFVQHLNFSPDHFLHTFEKAFATGLTGEAVSSLFLVCLSLPLLWRGRAALIFLLSALVLTALNAIVYSQVWHFGVLFLAWIFALWISCRQVGDSQPTAPRNWGLAALVVVITIHCYWTATAVRYDWGHPYSGGAAAAQGLKELNLAARRVYGIGFACVAIQPYFPHNIFGNWNEGKTAAYWDWSTHNHVNQDAAHLSDSRPDYVIVGYKNEVEHGVWSSLVSKAGYRRIRHFEGNSFWQTRVFEPESFDLYAAPDEQRP